MRILRNVLMLGLVSTGAFAADLQLQVEALPSATVRVGDAVTLRYTVTNLGPDASPLAAVLIPWPDRPTPTAFTCPAVWIVSRPDEPHGALAFTLEFGAVPAGVSETCEFTVPGFPQAGTYPISAQTYSQIDPNPANNSAAISLIAYAPGTPVPLFGGGATLALGLLMLLTGLRVRR